MEIIKKKINKIYRKTASLNLYISVCTIKKERITEELTNIKNDIEDVLEKLRA